MNDWLARTAEIVERYHPEIVWFDWWIETKEFEPYLQRFASFYYNDAAKRGSTAAINYKFDAYPQGAAVLDIERGQLDKPEARFWQTDTSVSIKSWGYIDNDSFRSPESLIHQLIDIVSKNGCLLLNIGPKSDGTIPEQEQKILLDMGRWLSVNGEAIYGTRPWNIYGEGPTKVVGGSFNDTATKAYKSQDIRFTTKGNVLYAIAMGWPENGKITIKALAQGAAGKLGTIGKVELVGSGAEVKWARDASGLQLNVPGPKTGAYAWVFRITHTAQ
jgi:alpha-L-fucosidase